MVPIQRSCDVENLADFSRYYAGSWVGWHPTDAVHTTPCYVGHLLDPDHIQLRPLSKIETGQIMLDSTWAPSWDDIKSHIDFGLPEIGMAPSGPTVVFSSYNTPRSPKKGYRARDTKLSEFNSHDIRKKYPSSRNALDRNDWVWFAFNPEYLDLQRALTTLEEGQAVGLPLSNTLGAYCLSKFRYPLLAYKRWTIGYISNHKLVYIKSPYADYEEDIIRQTGAEVVIVG